MKIYADDNMPLATEFFQQLGEVQLFKGRELAAEDISDADVLLVRSITQVNATLLAQCPHLQFVGTATIGMDHLDLDYLAARNIAVTNAPGCNAQSVVEYVLSCLLILAEESQTSLADLVVGVVGCGQIGRRLVVALQQLGVSVLQCDPLRAQAEPDFAHVPLQQLYQRVDVLSLHVPLVKTGDFPTYHLIGAAELAELPPHVALLNACRGAVVDNQALLQAMLSGATRPLFFDVWEHEPAVEQRLLPYCRIATPHIAGHSVEGKARGTEMLYQALCAHLQQQPSLHLADFLPEPMFATLQINAIDPTNFAAIARLLYDVRADDARFRRLLMTHGFDWLRKNYPARREFSALQLKGEVPSWLKALGFQTAD